MTFSCAILAISSVAAAVAGTGYLSYKWAKTKQLPNPDQVQTIYTPPHPSTSNLAKLSAYAAKISQLKMDQSVMGIDFVPNERDELTPIYIRCFQASADTVNFSARDLATDQLLGFAFTNPFLRSNQYLASYWLAGRPDEYTGYGSSKEEVSKVLLYQVTNQSTYKNIGVILNKAIHQKFESECQARIIIDAVRTTHPYHYKLGFRSLDSAKNREYAQYVRNHTKPDKDLGMVGMHLPDEARRLWLDEIHRHPIAFPELL